ncbi:hypothetical protein HXX76_002639 [Chlamydomonas incerta]|uniref:SNF2 super family n=1 Tax=Chlamydomonas incerta TaxID=51695 RepID=A0A835TCF6_CHLIN|nr:hypothetical protein HXX76_002639 [Chlamydomonas incerta]|eukprot:KAG2442553.1 hypothetical protein HXX76_002639 [Chlamydomonas incerta]
MPSSDVLTASFRRKNKKLPTSESSEEGLEDFSSDDEVADEAPALAVAAPQQGKLRRLVRGGVQSGAAAPAKAEEPQQLQQPQQPLIQRQPLSRGSFVPDDDLLAGLSNLALGSGPRASARDGSGAAPQNKPIGSTTSSSTSAPAAAAAVSGGPGVAGRPSGAAAAVHVPAYVAGSDEQDEDDEEDLQDSDSEEQVEDDEDSDDGSRAPAPAPPRHPTGLNSRGAPAAAQLPSQQQQRSAVPSNLSTQRQEESNSDGDSDSRGGARDNDSDDEEQKSFFERIAPSADAVQKAAAAAAAGAAGAKDPAQEPGALVLRSAVEPGRRPYVLAAGVARRLYPHQVVGVRWLWSLYDMQRGGILGDDMGLGKTMQCAAFLAGLLGSGLARRALIIAPKTLLPHWAKELRVCGLASATREYFGSSVSERNAALRAVAGGGGGGYGGGAAGRGVLVTTYGMVQHNAEELTGPRDALRGAAAAARGEEEFRWDVVLLDEGHKIKNPKMKLVEQLRKLPARVRVIISGTPIQNNLMEMHSLFDFTTEGLLGDARAFKTNYERPITKGLDKEATARERQTGAAIAAALRSRLEPFFLRREKKDVLTGKRDGQEADGEGGKAQGGGAQDAGADAGPSTSGSGAAAAADGGQARAQSLPRKNDLVVWLRLTALQRKIYTAFLHTDSVRQVLSHTASPLAAITVLKKICDHPALLSANAATSVIRGAHRWANDQKGGKAKAKKARPGRPRTSLDDFIVDSDEEETEEDEEEEETEEEEGASEPEEDTADNLDGGDLTAEWLSDEAGGGGDVSGASLHAELARELEHRGAEASCKSAFVLALLGRLAAAGHRTLIFSQSKVMLSILEAGVRAMDLEYCRIDGDVDDRQAVVARFQNSKTIPVFLLTSQVGGLGLTLTAADRVIIVDPAWNPSVDNQSVDRAYRMGQTRDVVVYRLITCGTVEEKIYRKQVFKGGLSRTGTEDGIQFRYFTQTELKDLFSVSSEGLRTSSTQQQLDGLHRHQRAATRQLEAHLADVLRMEGVAGTHDHDLLFSQRPEEVAPTAQEGDKILSQMNRGASGGVAGVDALADMLGAGMRLGGAAGAAGAAANMPALKQRAAFDAARRTVDELQARLRSMETTSSIAAKTNMLDGGKKVLERKAALQLELQRAQETLAALEASGRNSGSAGAGVSSGGAGAGVSSGGAGGGDAPKPLGRPMAPAGGGGGIAGAGAGVGPSGRLTGGFAPLTRPAAPAGTGGAPPVPAVGPSAVHRPAAQPQPRPQPPQPQPRPQPPAAPAPAPDPPAQVALAAAPAAAAGAAATDTAQPARRLGFGHGAMRRAAASNLSGGGAAAAGAATEAAAVPPPRGAVARPPPAGRLDHQDVDEHEDVDKESSLGFYSATSSVIVTSSITGPGGAGSGAEAAAGGRGAAEDEDEATSKCIDLTLSP